MAPEAADYGDPRVTGRPRPLISQSERAISWEADPTATVLRRIHAAEGHPGVLDTIDGIPFHLFGAHHERALRGRPGELLAQRHGAICRATVDGAVWITHLKAPGSFKLPAVRALLLAGHELGVPELPAPLHAPLRAGHTFREIAYEEQRRRRLPVLRLLQRRDEHRPVPTTARRLPLRRRAAGDQASSC